MTKQKPKSRRQEHHPTLEEPGRTPGRAEGDEMDVEGITGPQAREQESCCEEPKRTPGKAEG